MRNFAGQFMSHHKGKVLFALTLMSGLPSVASTWERMQMQEPYEPRTGLNVRGFASTIVMCARCQQDGCMICSAFLPPYVFYNISAVLSDIWLLPVGLGMDSYDLLYARPRYERWLSIANAIDSGEYTRQASATTEVLHDVYRFSSRTRRPLKFAGVSTDNQDRWLNLLGIACAAKNTAAVRDLLALGADPNEYVGGGQPVFFLAAEVDSPEILDILVKAGADVTRKSQYDETLEDYALKNGAYDVAHAARTEYGRK